jgi:hypothetical protein
LDRDHLYNAKSGLKESVTKQEAIKVAGKIT